MDRKNISLAPRVMRLGFVSLVGLGLTGCTIYNDPYRHSGVSVGVSAGYYDPYYDDYYDPYYTGYYYGWYEDYYYPGTGYYVYDRRGDRHRWSDHHRRYWVERRSAVRDIRENWAGYSRDRDGYYRDQRRRVASGDHEGRREHRNGRHSERRDNGDESFGVTAVRRAAERAAARQADADTRDTRSSGRTTRPATSTTSPRREARPTSTTAPRREARSTSTTTPRREARPTSTAAPQTRSAAPRTTQRAQPQADQPRRAAVRAARQEDRAQRAERVQQRRSDAKPTNNKPRQEDD